MPLAQRVKGVTGNVPTAQGIRGKVETQANQRRQPQETSAQPADQQQQAREQAKEQLAVFQVLSMQSTGRDRVAQRAHAFFYRGAVGLVRVKLDVHLFRRIVDTHLQHALNAPDAVLDHSHAVGAIHPFDGYHGVMVAVDDFRSSALGQPLDLSQRDRGGIVVQAQAHGLLVALQVRALETFVVLERGFKPGETGIVFLVHAWKQELKIKFDCFFGHG